MSSVLFTIGKFNVYSFGIFIAVAFILSTFVIYKLAREEFKEEKYLDAYFYSALAVLISARIIYIIRNFESFGLNILKYFLVVETSGLSLLGGGIGGIIFLYFYSRRQRIDFFHLADNLSVAASLALVFIKIGQLMSGAVYGIQTDTSMRIKIAGRQGTYHPVELYESFIFLLLFTVLFYLYKKAVKNKWASGLILSIFTFTAILSTILLEFLKVNRVYLYSLSVRQLAGFIILFFISIFFIIRTNLIRKLLNNFKKTK